MARSHLVGSMNLDSADAVFRLVADVDDGCFARIPDGETGPRAGWIFSMIARLEATDGLVRSGTLDAGYTAIPQFTIADGVEPGDVRFALGIDTDAIAAAPTFAALKAQGVIAPVVRFQLAIPTAMAVVGNFIAPQDRGALFAVYEARLREEIANATRLVGAGELAVQWDVAVEFGLMEGAFGPHPLSDEQIIDQVVRMSTLVADDVELGYHLCYGDAPPQPGAKGRHFVEPRDAALLVRVANAIAAGAARPISFIHMPVPIARDDDAYFAPLDDLRLAPATTLFLGLVHAEDGLDGAQRRIAAATRHVTGFGVGCECGMQNERRDEIPGILRTHRDAVVPA